MENKSIWQDIHVSSDTRKMPSSMNTDILIIGGGITGLSSAYFLKDLKSSVTLIDKDVVGKGISAKTTAKITYLQGTIYQTLSKKFGKEKAKEYLDSQIDAIKLFENIIKVNHIDCDFKKVDSVLFTVEPDGIDKVEKERSLLSSWKIRCENVVSDKIEAGFKVDNSYTFHPIKYLNSLRNIVKEYVSIFENVMAYDIQLDDGKYIVKTNQGVIFAKDVIVACHYPFFLLPLFIPFKTYIKREFVNAGKIGKTKDYSAINVDNNLHSIRFYDDYLIYGSNQQRLTSKLDYKKGYDNSRYDFKKYFGVDPSYTWMNQDIMSNDSLPFIGKISDHLYIATAYNAWGMTNGTLAAFMIAGMIKGGYYKYTNLFNPKRFNIPLLMESFLGSFHYMKAYGQSLFCKNNPSFVTIKGISYGVYRDEMGHLHKVKLLCPHMKCHLVFNREELTWDCPCHGSRFDVDGNIILGPATKKIDSK